MKTFSEKLLELRRREGLSQEQLADRLGVTRQSVSKWESGAAAPELTKLVALSDLFSVSVDYLVKDRLEEPERPAEATPPSTARLEEQVEEISSYFRGYAYDSKARLWGLPLVSIRFRLYGHPMRTRDVARGVFAIGNIAVGLVSFGLISAGLLSLGLISAGLLSIGCLAFGLAALGPVAAGLLAFGPVALGLWYAGGVTALGGKIAVGVAAVGDTAVGYDAAGNHVLLWGDGLTQAQVEAFLLEHHPKLWRPLLKLLALFGANIK